MAITSTGYQAPATSREGLKPSVLDVITLIGPDETPLLTKMGRSTVTNPTHSWIYDRLPEGSRSPRQEISDVGTTGKSTKQKNQNAVEIFVDEAMVSKSSTKVSAYGGKELPHELKKTAIAHKKSIEMALLGLNRPGTGTTQASVTKAPTFRSGDGISSGDEGEMSGLFYYCAKGATSFSSGARGNILAFDSTNDWAGTPSALTWDRFNEVLQKIWDSGASPKDVYVGTELKSAINTFAKDYRQLKSGEKKWSNIITEVETDFGVVNVHLHRYLSATYGLADAMIAGDFEYSRVGYLYPTDLEDVSTSKTAIIKRYYTEATLEVRNADAFAIGVGLSAS